VQEPNLKVMTPSSMLNEKCKKLEIIGSSEPRRIQWVRKEKHIDTYFISTDLIVILVEGDRNTVLKRTPMIQNMEDDLKTLSQAMSSKDAAFFKEAVNDEMDSILSNNTWVQVDLPTGSKPIGCKWVFRRKYNTNGSIQIFKARLVAKCFTQKEGVNYFDTYSPVARITSITVLFALASIYKLYVHQMDVKTTFLNEELKEEMYMEQPEGFIVPRNEEKVWNW